jgi:hypothetical protein
MTSEAPIFVHRRAAMISPQRHRDRIAAFGRHQNHVGRKKRKEAKGKRLDRFARGAPFLRLLSFFAALFCRLLSVFPS